MDKAFGRTHVTRERQLRDEDKSGGTQPANISLISRRNIGSASESALEHNRKKTAEKQLGRERFSS